MSSKLKPALESALTYLEAQLDDVDSRVYIVPRLIKGYVALAETGICVTPNAIYQRRMQEPTAQMPSIHGDEDEASEWDSAVQVALKIIAAAETHVRVVLHEHELQVLPPTDEQPFEFGRWSIVGDEIEGQAIRDVVVLALEWCGLEVKVL